MAKLMSTVVSVKGVPKMGEKKRKAVEVEASHSANGKEKHGHRKSSGPHGAKKIKR